MRARIYNSQKENNWILDINLYERQTVTIIA